MNSMEGEHLMLESLLGVLKDRYKLNGSIWASKRVLTKLVFWWKILLI